ncbi:MAG TPA: hypothetical protein VN577_04460 [Terriglobales bacterium]|nr:hypothetical protein [Terriglobales bacterium]
MIIDIKVKEQEAVPPHYKVNKSDHVIFKAIDDDGWLVFDQHPDFQENPVLLKRGVPRSIAVADPKPPDGTHKYTIRPAKLIMQLLAMYDSKASETEWTQFLGKLEKESRPAPEIEFP